MSILNVTPELRQRFAPTGRLRASVNLGNPILVKRDAPEGAPYGVSVDLARGLADLLGVELELVVVHNAGASVNTVRSEQADIGFFAIDPARSEGLLFTAPYVLIEGCYLVKNDSALQANEDVDQAGIRVTVGKGSAYDLFLSRRLQHAEIVRAPTSPTVVDEFVAQGLDVAAGVKQQLEADQLRHPGHRLLPGRFMVIQQAMGAFASKGAQVQAFLAAYVEQQKASGFVQASLQRNQIDGASVAPLA
jgi:polar amino acid transport system substrate-binding protein